MILSAVAPGVKFAIHPWILHDSTLMNRRNFISLAAPAAVGVLASGEKVFGTATLKPVPSTQPSPEGCFTLGKRGKRWVLLTPDRKPFFSAGLNHIDSSPLRYPENLNRWEQRYGNDTIR